MHTYVCRCHTDVCMCVALFRRLLPVQTNTDEHDPVFCRDNFNITLPDGNRTRNPNCAIDPEFEGAPPTVIILCDTVICFVP